MSSLGNENTFGNVFRDDVVVKALMQKTNGMTKRTHSVLQTSNVVKDFNFVCTVPVPKIFKEIFICTEF